jgi:hypothetical protein
VKDCCRFYGLAVIVAPTSRAPLAAFEASSP